MTSRVVVNPLSLVKGGWEKWAYFGNIKTKVRNVFPGIDVIIAQLIIHVVVNYDKYRLKIEGGGLVFLL